MVCSDRSPGPASGPRPSAAPPDEEARGRVLLVDDEPTVLGGYERALAGAGYLVEGAADGREAVELLESRDFDVIVSDIRMPDMDGIQLLRAAREHDLDVPVILITGTPSVESAIKAVEYGALRYMVKPVDLGELEDVVGRALRLRRMAVIKRRALALTGGTDLQPGDRAGLEVSFERALASLWMAYQPIVLWSERRIYCYEALVRSAEPALPHPGALLDAAERLGRLHDLGRAIRRSVSSSITQVPGCERVFVNLHPQDLPDEELFSPAAPLSAIADRVVLEITERASLERIGDLTTRVARLRGMGFRIAIDDLGAGYAGLSAFAQLQPEVVKIDMSLVRGVDGDPTKQKLIHSLASLCEEMGIMLVAEGIETIPERDALVPLGIDLLQGHLFALPGRPYPRATL